MQFMKTFIKIFFCNFLYHVKYNNLEILQKADKCLICPNHSNIFDPTFIYPVADNLYIMAKADIFKNRLIAKFLKHYNVFPVVREKTDVKSMITSLEIFKGTENKKLLMFPEGKVIKEDTEIKKSFRKGAVYIAANANVPIIPVYISRRPKFFSKVIVTFGNPIFINKDSLDSKQKILDESKKLIDTIYNLS